MINFAVNVRADSCCKGEIGVILKRPNDQYYSDIFILHDKLSDADTTFTLSMGGIMADISDCCDSTSLFLKLISPDSLMIESAMISIIAI